jgi:hypothetical protein
LAKTFTKSGVSVFGDDNWLNDSDTNADITAYKDEQKAAKETKPPKATDNEKAVTGLTPKIDSDTTFAGTSPPPTLL